MTSEPTNARGSPWPSIFDAAVLIALLGFLSFHVPPRLLLLDTTTVGGDTPAHNYLASHLRDQLLHHGRIVGWAQGWWCGFPMFQFYFCLPYLLIAALSLLIPFNIAFKLVCVLGIYAMPPACYAAMRLLRLPRPVPILTAIASLLFLFVKSHTMWGANIYSTLAGMISNSLSFPLLLLAIALAAGDVRRGSPRLRTVFLLAALMASHFFTSVMAAAVLAPLPFLQPRNTWRKALFALAVAGGLALLLMAWWLVPLAAKGEYSVEFGTNWNLRFFGTFPRYAFWLAPLVGYAAFRGLRDRLVPALLFTWMLAVSLFLFRFGFDLAPVFVNVRLWPFIFFAWLALAAIGLGLAVQRLRANELLVTAALLGCLLHISDQDRQPQGSAGPVRDWAEFNFRGLENRPDYPAFRDLVLPLKGTPGRLANDLADENNALGSSRIFETVPHLIGKPILEGGLVNSAVGACFSYYVQGETSESAAGFPTQVIPGAFNPTNAARHLALFNVKHFIARRPQPKQALRQSPDWRLLGSSRGWELYELLTHDGRYVCIPTNLPIAVRSEKRIPDALQWIYAIEALGQPFVLVGKNAVVDEPLLQPVRSNAQFCEHLKSFGIPVKPTPPIPGRGVFFEEIRDDRIRFRTDAVGLPHLIKCTYYPNWKVRGAACVYPVTPAFMLVYPSQSEVELYYGSTPADRAGWALTGLGWLAVLALALRRRK